MAVICTIIISALLALGTLAHAKTFPCAAAASRLGRESNISRNSVPLREGPGANHPRVINPKTTEILKRTIYAEVDTSVTVIVECISGAWAYVRVSNPDYLSESHQGWIESKFLKQRENVKIGNDVYSDWSHDFRTDITKVLARNKITGCGQYRYRTGVTNNDLYIVACTRDGKDWTTYKVSLSKGTADKI